MKTLRLSTRVKKVTAHASLQCKQNQFTRLNMDPAALHFLDAFVGAVVTPLSK